LVDNGYYKSRVCLVVWVTIVNSVTRQRIHKRSFLHNGGDVFVTTDKPKPLASCFDSVGQRLSYGDTGTDRNIEELRLGEEFSEEKDSQ
jgi:hypothetical protein